jgi:hypothetical protein
MSLFIKSIVVTFFLFSSSLVLADHITVDQWQYIPDISVELVQDVHSGWNLEINSNNFVFDPANAGGAHEIGHGHGHLYVNNKKVTRIYGHWTHIPSDWLAQGHNKVEVTLNANTHEELWYKNVVISDAQMIMHNGSNGDGHHEGH